jgi:TonB family protein
MYSIYYRDEEKLKAGMLNSYQKLGVDDPTKRRYISPIYTTDYDRNGWDEIWYVTISNGLVLEVLGLERCKEGWTALRLNDVFLSKINLEQSVRDLLEISTSKQDPFQRALSSPLSNELELWNSRGGSGNQGYDRIHFDSIESIDMDMSQDADMGTTAPEATQRVEDGFQEEAVYSFASVMPVYPGGGEQMHTDISMNLIYPEDAKADGVGGKVFLQFIVEKDGSISNIKTARGINGYPEMAQAAEQAVRKLKKFSPAEQNGKPVRLTMTVPITFKLQ